MITHKQATAEMVTVLVHARSALFAVGLTTVIIELAMILGHNV